MIPTYNCARFLRETLESVLSQNIDPAEMQIEVIDDCSTSDDPEAVVREFGQGRVSFYRKPANAGATANFNTCIERSTGYYVHILHGDDFIKPGFYRAIDRRAQQYGDLVDLFVSRCLVIDEHGALDSLSPRIKNIEAPSSDPSYMFLENAVKTPGCIIKRSFYEQHGGFLNILVHTADWEMWARATALGKGLFINEALAVYRYFEGNDTGRLARTGENICDFYRLSQVMAHRYSSYPRLQFLHNIASIAAGQFTRFQAMGDESSANANKQVARAISQQIPFDRKAFVKHALRKTISLVGL